MPKMTKDDIVKLTMLDDNTRADLSARFDEIMELETRVKTLTKEKADADVIVARAGEAEKAAAEKQKKIVELENLLAQHTGRPADEISLTMFATFFGQDIF